MSDARPDWDDARLNAAFVAWADAAAPAPPDLIAAVRARVAAVPRPVSGIRRFAPVLGLAAALAIAVIVGVGRLGRATPADSGAPSNAAETSGVSAPSTAQPALGEPISIVQAAAIRDAGVDDREIVVTGFLGGAGLRLPCPMVLLPRNPTRLDCPYSFAWLMQDPESLTTSFPDGSGSDHPPVGPAIHPSFALVDQPAGPNVTDGDPPPTLMTVVGHFDDRRAALCPAADQAACRDTFVVDQVLAVDGNPRGVVTELRNQRFDDATQKEVTEQPTDLQEDVDRMALAAVPGGAILSRLLVTIDQVIGIEPVLANDGFVPYVGNPATLMWIVTVVAPSDGIAKTRTFVLMDGSNWFGEVTSSGMVMIERSGWVRPPAQSGPPVASADPAAFDAAPTSVLGIEVRDVATVMHDRRADFGDLGRDEMAIRAWSVSPNPAMTCDEGTPAIHAPTPPCDDSRHWLLDDPVQFGAEVGQVRRDPEHWPAVLNPLLPVDVPFDVPASWVGDVPMPQPVVVLGHFVDNRVNSYHGNVYFVLDALAWARDRSVGTLDTLTRLTSAATEDPASVLARVGKVSPNDAVATWTTVVDAADFASMEPRVAADAPEFTSGRPVWIVRRLVRNETDGRQRLAVEWSYTTDAGSRVWLTATPDSQPDLATTLDVGPFGKHTREIRVYDYDQWIVSVRRATAADNLNWRPTSQERDGRTPLEVARGPSDREVGVRWKGAACAPDWRVLVTVHPDLADPGPWIQAQTFGDGCDNPTEMVTRALIITFDRPIDLNRVRAVDDRCCG